MSRHPTFGVLAIAAFAALCAALSASPASARSEPCSCLGLSGGQFRGQYRGQIDESRTSNRLIGPRLTFNSITPQDCDMAWKAFGRYQSNPNLAVEAGFFSLGSFDFTTTTIPAGKLHGQTKLKGRNLDRVTTLPTSDPLSGLARTGGHDDTLTVEGHTDHLGTPAYNPKLALALQPAEAVKPYLVSSNGLAASKVSAVGKAETPPVTGPEDCKGERATPKLISCLQANRQVDVEVTGTC